jgi:quinol monooxygenase YgiN
MLISINEFHVKPGGEKEFEMLFAQVTALILQEPGCRSCRLHREREAERTYVSYVEWESEAALAAPHDPAIGALIARYPLEEPPRRRRFDVVAPPGVSS